MTDDDLALAIEALDDCVSLLDQLSLSGGDKQVRQRARAALKALRRRAKQKAPA